MVSGRANVSVPPQSRIPLYSLCDKLDCLIVCAFSVSSMVSWRANVSVPPQSRIPLYSLCDKLDCLTVCVFSISSMVAGRGLLWVSGKARVNIPPIIVRQPKSTRGICFRFLACKDILDKYCTLSLILA